MTSGRPGVAGRVVVVSSANHDIVVTADRIPLPGETVAGSGVRHLNGGKGANQAVAAARAGAAVVFVGAVGDDEAGRSALDDLASAGVDVSAVQVVAGEVTGTALVTVGADAENSIVVIPGANGRLGVDDVRAALARLELTDRDICVLGFEVGDAIVLAAGEAAFGAGARVAVNPSPVREVPATLWALRPIVIANASEALELTGCTTVDEAATALRDRTGAPLVITLGAEGALWLDATGPAGRVPANRVTPVDTTGAGDTFAGVYVAALATEADLERATRRAVVAAGLSVTVAGARASSPTAEAIDAAE